MKRIDLNCDMAELPPGSERNYDEEIMPYISSCNVSCGFHSGSPEIIENTIRLAIAQGVKIGAHPSYNDRANYGRLSLDVPRKQLLAELRYQICAVKGILENLGGSLHHVKPHGALYNDMVEDKDLALHVIRLIKEVASGAKVYGLAESQVSEICKQEGVPFSHEAFADRAYETKTSLRSRAKPNAVLHDESQVLEQVDKLTSGAVITHDGRQQNLKVDTICLHSDTPGAVALSKKIHEFVKAKGIEIA